MKLGKKILLAILLAIFSLSAKASEEYYVPDNVNPAFEFSVISPGEYIEFRTSDFLIPFEYTLPLLISAENWIEKFEITPVHKAKYYYFSKNIYNAYANSTYISVVEKPYKVTMVNAALHGWTDLYPYTHDADGEITVGNSLDPYYYGWQTDNKKQALYHLNYLICIVL